MIGDQEGSEFVKIHETEKSGVSLQITKKRGLILKKCLNAAATFPIPGTSFVITTNTIKFVSASTSCDEIDFPLLGQVCRDMLTQKELRNRKIVESYNLILDRLEDQCFPELDGISQYLSKIDVLQCKAYIARQYRYCRPEIVNDAPRAFVDTRDLRHVLIEHLQTKEIYVANDLSLSSSSSSSSSSSFSGILLYGTNAVGKTSLIRALGISVIMAQAGLYVPCSQFRFKPYTAIFSRILGNDNLFKGLSTFAVEMSELRVILKMADENSLILGDELCSGTETESALSIFVAGLMDLHSKESSFIFATHFHEIIKYDEIVGLNRLALKHMAVHYDRELDALVYDRKLKDGPGNRMYGLEVCKSLHLSDDFLDSAYKIRSKYWPNTQGELGHGVSVYNASKIRGLCEMCKTELGEETHHIAPQKEADKDGFIGHTHKNHPANLMTVCQKCHDKIHTKTEKIVRKKTTKGYKLTQDILLPE